MVKDGDGVERKRDPEAQAGEEPGGEQHRLDPVLTLVARVVPCVQRNPLTSFTHHTCF